MKVEKIYFYSRKYSFYYTGNSNRIFTDIIRNESRYLTTYQANYIKDFYHISVGMKLLNFCKYNLFMSCIVKAQKSFDDISMPLSDTYN